MAKGKGNKLYNISKTLFESGEEFVLNAFTLNEDDQLKIYAGKKHTTIKPLDLEYYVGERAQRGHKLPRGYQKVSKAELIRKD